MTELLGNLSRPSADWLTEQFEFEYCAECGGDAQHHAAVPLMGNWFARCNCAPADDGEFHPAVRKFRAEEVAR